MAKFSFIQLFSTTDDGWGIWITSLLWIRDWLLQEIPVQYACCSGFIWKTLKHVQKEKIGFFFKATSKLNHILSQNIFLCTIRMSLSETVEIIHKVTWKLNWVVSVLTWSKQNMLIGYFQNTKFFVSFLSILCMRYGSDPIVWNTEKKDRILESRWILPIHTVT